MRSKFKFKDYLLNEQHEYLAHKVGDILTAVHELIQGGKQIGARQLVKHSEVVVNQIRKVLHSSWPRSEMKYLRTLQKVGVAIMKTIDEKGDLPETLNGARVEIEKLQDKMGQPINHLATPAKDEGQEQAQAKTGPAPGGEAPGPANVPGAGTPPNPNNPVQAM
jgi:hypothetical protein